MTKVQKEKIKKKQKQKASDFPFGKYKYDICYILPCFEIKYSSHFSE